MVTAVPPLLVTVNVRVLLPRNTSWPKSPGFGVTETSDGWGVPMPITGTFTVGLADVVDRILNVPDRKPTEVGPNATSTVHSSPSPRVSSQVSDTIANAPLTWNESP